MLLIIISVIVVYMLIFIPIYAFYQKFNKQSPMLEDINKWLKNFYETNMFHEFKKIYEYIENDGIKIIEKYRKNLIKKVAVPSVLLIGLIIIFIMYPNKKEIRMMEIITPFLGVYIVGTSLSENRKYQAQYRECVIKK